MLYLWTVSANGTDGVPAFELSYLADLSDENADVHSLVEIRGDERRSVPVLDDEVM